eukprot:TRINITY_DN12600_c0_g1_i2.p1 TRINITY_DN12600_c0_g1~~TRINITY_DN12600_c0_g1_i2.p1  ORF type:complete len:234 (-),score=29.93 TRINITY_DN12600_c0_g1_i2:768-1430(-)
MLSAAMRLQRPKASGALSSAPIQFQPAVAARFGDWVSPLDTWRTKTSESPKSQLPACSRCGCSSLCWCESCRNLGCTWTNGCVMNGNWDFQVTVNVGLAGETCEMTASAAWSFKHFVRALASETHMPSRHLRILHGSPLDFLDACGFEKFLATTGGEEKHVEVTAIFDETADEDVASSSSELDDNDSLCSYESYDYYCDDPWWRPEVDYDSDLGRGRYDW